MSYAQVASHNAPPPSQQPHADLGLLNTDRGVEHPPPDVDMAKVTVVSHDFKEHPVTETTLVVEHSETSSDEDTGQATAVPPLSTWTLINCNAGNVPGNVPGNVSGNVPGSRKHKSRSTKERQRKRQVRRVERKFEGWVDWTKDKLFQPAVAGGVFAVVNIGVLGTIGYHVYKRPTLITEPRLNARPLAYTSAGLIGLFTLESLAANAYLETAQGQEELRRAEEEGHLLYNKTKEVVLRPKVAGGILGAANLAVLSALGYGVYVHWDSHVLTRRNVSYISIGLITWFSLQGWAVEKYYQEDISHRY
ncbi:hypothetical protein FRC17_001100 [Serendipita sp. 399]|nr:hypothetical protein FRC17_001100 [Serendipita sp. 399]